VTDEVQRNVFVVQRPPRLDHFDVDALSTLGKVDYLAPNAPNIHDPERLLSDYRRMLKAISEAGAEDVFLALGGSPVSNWLFGAALYASGTKAINVAMYSRDIDGDGRRLDKGRYRIVSMATDFPDEAGE
jgi:hypothetical protein